MIQESIKLLNLNDENRILELGHGNYSHLDNIMKADLDLYEGSVIPYVYGFFDKILTVNTVCFWEFPLLYLNEIYRVLKLGDIFILTFAKSSFMKDLAFVSKTNVF